MSEDTRDEPTPEEPNDSNADTEPTGEREEADENPETGGETTRDLEATEPRERVPGDDEVGDEHWGAESDLPDDLFENQDVEDVDREELWEQVASEGPPEADASESAASDGPTVERPDGERRREQPQEGVERIVDKGKYCRNCEHFSSPPDVRCTHEGTEILEAVDMDHFRVVDCPVVREDEELKRT